MKISKYRFESELDALITAAYSAPNAELARRFLIEAKNKINGYDDIPDQLVKLYMDKVESAAKDLDVSI